MISSSPSPLHDRASDVCGGGGGDDEFSKNVSAAVDDKKNDWLKHEQDGLHMQDDNLRR
jgi:hypothetical protein